MKKWLLSLWLCLLVGYLFAQNSTRNDNQNASQERSTYVTAAEALDVGYTFMHTGNHGRGDGNVNKQTMQLVYTGTATDSLTRAITECYYVFSLQPKGFVIVAADERVEPILGYSYDNNFMAEGMPDNVRDWIDLYGKQIKAAVDNDWQPSAEITEKWTLLKLGQTIPTRSTTSVSPLIQTTWNQNRYYNQLCPADASGPNGHAYAGCAATAMAQIIRYWEWPDQGFNSYSYDHSLYGTLSVDFGSATYNYDNMPNSLNSSSATTQINEVAKLIYHCGVSIGMGYGTSSSSASPYFIPAALYDYFAYADNGIYVAKSDYSDNDWANMIRQELDNARPAYYVGWGNSGGHGFICDGYDNSGAFHFNWGWSGNYDGYYTLDNLTSYGSYTDNQQAIIGISAARAFIRCSESEMSFTAPLINTESEVQTVVVRAHSLENNISVSVGEGYRVSTNGSDFYNSVTLPAIGGNFYVKFTPTSYGRTYGELLLISDSCFASVSLNGLVIESPPILITDDVSNIGAMTANCGGDVTYAGNSTIIERGVCWSTTHNPTTADLQAEANTYTIDPEGGGHFTAVLTGLTPNTTYYVRSYATNSMGINYGNEVSFTTIATIEGDAQPCPNNEIVTDYDGNNYNTVKIGNQCWMKENLRVTHYVDGTEISPIYAPNNDANNVVDYGYLYPWSAVMFNLPSSNANPSGVQGICPTGWHVPSADEWGELINYCSQSYKCNVFSESVAKALSSQTGWSNSDDICTVGYEQSQNNMTGFKALPAGWYAGALYSSSFGDQTWFWSTSERSETTSQRFHIAHNSAIVNTGSTSSWAGLSVRCVHGLGLNLSTVTTNTVGDVTTTSAICSGNVTYDGNSTVIARGICWDTEQNPTIDDSHVSDGSGTGTFSCVLTGLEPSTTYYVRAYSTNGAGTSYGEQKAFTTLCDPLEISISGNTIIGYGENTILTAYGAANPASVGDVFCTDGTWVSPNDYVSSGKTALGIIFFVDSINRSGWILNLQEQGLMRWEGYGTDIPSLPNSGRTDTAGYSNTMIIRAYGDAGVYPAAWAVDIISGWYLPAIGQLNILNGVRDTVNAALAIVGGTTFGEGNIWYYWSSTEYSAECTWTLSYTGSCSVYAKINSGRARGVRNFCCGGYVWNTGQTTASITVNPTSTTTYTVTGTNSFGCTGTANVTVTVNYLKPTVTTNNVTNIGTATATCGGNVTANGGLEVTACGVCWSTSHNPTITDAHTTDGGGMGFFTSTITGLDFGTTYYVRAYATNSVGTSYGEEMSFTTKCENVASLPYTDNFDDYTTTTTVETGVQPSCWEVITEDVALTSATMPQVYRGYATSGSYSLRLKNRCVYAMPSLEEYFNVQDLILTFKLRQPKTIYRLQVGVVNDDGVFQVVRTINNTSTDMEDITVNFSNYTGNGHRIAFRNTLASGSNIDYSINYIDDVVLNVTCGIYLLPYAENFDDCTTATTAETGAQPECWEVISEDVALTNATKPQVYRGYATSGSYSLRMKNRCVFAMPVLKNNVNIQELAMTFKLRQPNAIYRLQVGVVNENGEFEVVKTINNASTEIENVKVKFSDYTGNGRRIAFRNTLPSSSTLAYSTNYIDDIVLDYTCDINELPYTEDFDNCTTVTTTETGVQPNCWEVITEDVALTEATMPQVYRGYATSGSYSLRMKNRCVFALPEMEDNISVPDLILTFKLRQPKAVYRLQVGVVDNQGNFNLVKTINNASTDMEDVMVDFANYTGNGHRIAFRNTLASGSTLDYSVNYLDDVVLSKRKSECSITIEMHDSYGDGWNGNKIRVHNHDTIQEVTLDSGREGSATITVYDGSLDLEWVNGNWINECSFTVTGPCLYYSGGAPAQGVFQSTVLDCDGGTSAVSSFTYWTENTCNSVIVHFENTSTNANVATWNIGNYSTNEWNPTYEFTESGSYPVTLTTSNNVCDNSNSVINNVQITLPEPISITKDTVVCVADLPLTWYGHTFTGTDTNAFTLQSVNGCDSMVTLIVYASENGLVSMSLGSAYYTQAASNERIVMVADYNNDNHEDLITRIHPSGEIRFYRNTGNTMVYDYSLHAQPYAFSSACDENNNGQASNTSSLMDFDNDGVTDFLVYSANHANCSSNAVRIYWGSATYPYFTDADYTELNISSPYCVGAYGTDLNNDGLTDVLIRNCGPTNLYMNEGDRVFTQTSVFNTGRDINVIFDDYNLDGNVDLCYTKNGWADGQWGMRLNKGNGNGTFNTSTIKNYTNERPLDGFLNFHSDPLDDNLPDIAFTCNNDGTNNSIVYIGEWNNSINNFQFATLGVFASEETRIVQAFDINGDNYEDLIIRLKTGNSYSAKAYLNDGHGNFTCSISVLRNSSYYPYKFWREAGRILMAAYHGTARDSILVYELTPTVCGTMCPKIATMPYTENFDSYTNSHETETGVEPDCWKVVTEDVALTNSTKPQVYYNASYATSGSYSLRMKNRCVYAMPELMNDINIQDLTMTFNLRQPKAVYRLQVGVVDAQGNFTSVKTINNASTETEEVSVDFANYTGRGHRIAFRNTVPSSSTLDYSINYIDNITLDYPCENIELPYAENFDEHTTSTIAETGVQPRCWEVVAEDVALTDATKPQVYYNTTYATSGSYTLRMKNRCVYAMPALDENVNVNELTMTFNLRQPKAVYRLQVGVLDNQGNFKVVKTINNASTETEEVSVDFANYTGSGHRIAFRNTVPSSSTLDYSVNYIDNVVLDYTGACRIIVLPYTENFEGFTTSSTAETGVQPECWEVVAEDVALSEATMPQLYCGYASSGSYSLRMKNRCVYAMPELYSNIHIPALTMTFTLRQPKSVYRLQVGVVDNQGNFELVKTINNASTGTESITVDFANYTGNGYRIAFRNTLGGSSTLDYSINYIDDINLDFNSYAVKEKTDEDVNGAMNADRDLVDIVIYPNPTKDYINVECTMNNVQSEVKGVEVIDVYGKVVRTVVGANNYSPTRINVSGLAAGMYFVRVTTERGAVTKPFVKR